MVRKIGLLVWKNFLLRKRHYIVTVLEVLLPTLCAFLVTKYDFYLDTPEESKSYRKVFMKSQVPSGVSVFQNETIYEAKGEMELISLAANVLCDECALAYAPNTDRHTAVMEKLKKEISTNFTLLPFENENDIEIHLANDTFNNPASSPFRGAVVFESNLAEHDDTASYKIRLVDHLPDTSMFFPVFQFPGPNPGHSEDYAISGFSGIQLILDKILANLRTNQTFTHKIFLQAFPYPPYEGNFDFSIIYFLLLPNVFVIGFMFMVPSIIRTVVSEKETGIRELLKLNGVPGWMQWVGWMINSLSVLTISITIVILLLFLRHEGGAVIFYGDFTLWWVILLLYIMSATSFCFFISAFFQKPSLATTVGIILWMASYYFPSVKIENNYPRTSLAEKLSVSLLPNMALHLAIKIMSGYEGKAVGARWWNIQEPVSSVDDLCLGHIILMFLVNTALYMLLTVYVENVIPSPYGIRKPWYYIFQLKTWYRRPPSKDPKSHRMTDYQIGKPGFEDQQPNVPVGVDIKKLRKKFGRKKIVVNELSARMYDGEIFVLLGHNGAGKTTTISMLTGLFAPSGGTAFINGFDITKELSRVRQNLGLCPQHNMLFDKLTVMEHLRFFGQLKGLKSAEARKECQDILRKLQLSEKANTLSMALSGGQKRKLSLGIALIGGTKVVILDEPTSGMDPEARRAIWDLLLEMRGSRTILMTTHYMEEADVLGDRIGIMANGKLQCSGTPMFLKKYYGTGYTLKLSLNSASMKEHILQLVQNHIPNAFIKDMQNTNISDLFITLPTDTAKTANLAEFFLELTTHKETLGIQTIGLSLTTMDEVFLRVGQLAEEGDNKPSSDGTNPAEPASQSTSETTPLREASPKKRERATGLALAKEQFVGLLRKKCIYTIRKRKLMFSQFLMPIMTLALAIYVSNTYFESVKPPPPLRMQMQSYKSPVTYVTTADEAMYNALAEVIGPSAQKVPSAFQAIVDVGQTDLASYRERHIIAMDENGTNFTAMFNTIPLHAAPLALNLASNALLESLDASRDYQISVTNHPLQSRMSGNIASDDSSSKYMIPIMFAVFMPIGLGLLAASFIVFPIEERLCKAKQLQMMTGVSPLTYWTAALLWDFFMSLIVICLMTACFPIFESHRIFTSYDGAGVAFLIMMVYGYSAISFSYLVSLFPGTASGGFSLVAKVHTVAGTSMCLAVFGLEIGTLLKTASIFRWVGRLFPTFGAAMSTMRYVEIAVINGKCNTMSEEMKILFCDKDAKNVPVEYRSCCDNCVELGADCFKATPYVTWVYEKASFGNVLFVPGIGQELLYMFLMACVYQVVLLLLEYDVIHRLINKMFKTDQSVFKTTTTDDDVIQEADRVTDLVVTGKTNEDAVVVRNFCKSYGSFAAVSNLTFGVHHGECFGLLGVNGAGKTTSFRMLTGDEYRSFGNAYAFSNNLEHNRTKFLANIGYCPQFDGIIGVLTGQEMLQLFCSLRGVRAKFAHLEANKWLTKLGLQDSADVPCGQYSGGMKRRLSVAMAMIGDPPLLLLDEPTSGVDPVSRRQFWQVLGAVRDSGQSIILTSHSMDECEALCSRLGIMVNGQLQCLGGVQHLKNKFAQGYGLSVKLKPMVDPESQSLVDLSAEIIGKFHPCSLKDKHQNVLRYQIHNTSLQWDVLFKTMENLKIQYIDIIEDYSVSETTLEEVFLSFARKQYGNRKADISLMKRIITCQCCK